MVARRNGRNSHAFAKRRKGEFAKGKEGNPRMGFPYRKSLPERAYKKAFLREEGGIFARK